jgi:antagonist of KipI
MSITILKPGISASIQDFGRWHYQKYGIPVGGVMDKMSSSVANIICGNEVNEALLELTLHGTEIVFNEDAYCCISGEGCNAYINDTKIEFNRLLKIKAFSILKTKPIRYGCRAYLAIAGGFRVNKIMGSVSTYAASGIGGINGKNLDTGDIIHFANTINKSVDHSTIQIGENGFGYANWHINFKHQHNNSNQTLIDCVKGPEWDLFNEPSQHAFFNTSFTISNDSNRMGYRLEGNELSLIQKQEMLSSAVAIGIIQVTPKGQPIILMADAQTIGGYPRIARVCSADISKIAQCRPGDLISFNQITEDESYSKLRELDKKIDQLKISIAMTNR